MVPTLLEKSKYDYSDQRGDLLKELPEIKLWDSKYRPSAPKGNFMARVMENKQTKAWSWYTTLSSGGDGVESFNVVVGSMATKLDSRMGGIGWKFSNWGGPKQVQQGVSWQECQADQTKGRAVVLLRNVKGERAEITIQFHNYFDKIDEECS